ncbi:hypothetical protein RHMOL_Rhmol10G0217400 [Rhododendron molle]|uniref:Uncharacterized protein n=1 Tax=Rhododendron molle TaxID=49168 RepID=A0ACC0M617_RHOML|nr:hypothetical protein RHMOL_Rhmol10G0217400 [Rhododendron molle]
MHENVGAVKAKNSPDEALQRWRDLCGVLKNPKRRVNPDTGEEVDDGDDIEDGGASCIGDLLSFLEPAEATLLALSPSPPPKMDVLVTGVEGSREQQKSHFI